MKHNKKDMKARTKHMKTFNKNNSSIYAVTFFTIREVYQHFAVKHFHMSDAMRRFYRFLYFKPTPLQKSDPALLETAKNLFNETYASTDYDNLIKSSETESDSLIDRLISCGFAPALFRTDSPTKLEMSPDLYDAIEWYVLGFDSISKGELSKKIQVELECIQNEKNSYLYLSICNLIQKIKNDSTIVDLINDSIPATQQSASLNSTPTTGNTQMNKSSTELDAKSIRSVNLFLLRECYKLLCLYTQDIKDKNKQQQNKTILNTFYAYFKPSNNVDTEKPLYKSATNPNSRFYDSYIRDGNPLNPEMYKKLQDAGIDMNLFDSQNPIPVIFGNDLFMDTLNHINNEPDARSLKELQDLLRENLHSTYDSQGRLFAESVRILMNKINNLDSEYWEEFTDTLFNQDYKTTDKNLSTQKKVKSQIQNQAVDFDHKKQADNS